MMNKIKFSFDVREAFMQCLMNRMYGTEFDLLKMFRPNIWESHQYLAYRMYYLKK